MAKSNRNLHLVRSDEAPTVEEELEAIEHEVFRSVSLLRVLARAVGDKDGHLELALQIAAEHLDDAHVRMDLALGRLRRTPDHN